MSQISYKKKKIYLEFLNSIQYAYKILLNNNVNRL